MPHVWAVGDTFGIVQGTTSGNSLEINVYSNGSLIYVVEDLQLTDGLFATSITIPAKLPFVDLVMRSDGNEISTYQLNSGEVLRVDISQEQEVRIQQDESFIFQPLENQKQIEDISRGEIEEYKDEMMVESLEDIKQSLQEIQETQEREQQIQTQEPQTPPVSTTQRVNEFFLQPGVLFIMMMVCCILIIILVLKKRDVHL